MPWVNCSVEFQTACPEATGLADWFPTRPGHRLGHSEHSDKQNRNSLLTSRVPGALDSRLWALAAGHGSWLGPGDGHAVGLRHGCGSSTLVGSRTKSWLCTKILMSSSLQIRPAAIGHVPTPEAWTGWRVGRPSDTCRPRRLGRPSVGLGLAGGRRPAGARKCCKTHVLVKKLENALFTTSAPKQLQIYHFHTETMISEHCPKSPGSRK